MKYAQKTLRPRLPMEARETLKKGGRQEDQKKGLRRQSKHRNKMPSGESL